MATTASTILERIRQRQYQVWMPKDFLDLGKRAAVDKALSRLVGSEELRRIGHGLYDMPRFNPILKRFAPVSLNAAIARRDNIRIIPDGSVAANRLGPQAVREEQVLSVLKRRLLDSLKQDLVRNVRHLPGWILSITFK